VSPLLREAAECVELADRWRRLRAPSLTTTVDNQAIKQVVPESVAERSAA
jgi:hypothetical protein